MLAHYRTLRDSQSTFHMLTIDLGVESELIMCFSSYDSAFWTCIFIHHVSKNCAKLFLPELRQISTNFDNFWQKDGKEANIMRCALIFHLT